MSIEDLNLTFCQNEELIKELQETKEKLELKLKYLTKQITELEEYKEYINNSESEEKRLKLINTEMYKEFLETKQKLDKIKEKLSEEETKLTKQEFEEVVNKARCNHLFYKLDEEEKVCIKCNHIVGTKKTQNIKELRSNFIYVELSSPNEDEYVTEFLQNEILEHLIDLTNEILKKYKTIDNEKLQEKLEEKISEDNIKYIEGMYQNPEDMPEDTKESYESYKKRTKR